MRTINNFEQAEHANAAQRKRQVYAWKSRKNDDYWRNQAWLLKKGARGQVSLGREYHSSSSFSAMT
jgi:hypothetical protein